ncbi:hypothetical protein BKA67DRAFT_660159 [Truncatella angustata]|uniref:Uncharacterized protein n=1 Tax=Truncatella angustata TaxID=152316 RepID=A0A9P8UJG0_9PEZI|nr:uncharacterized protein BKA67DRAFT_660159 [Truncatella angustata]KAH6653573.1 hypothetical protein BKA67DRAFT_660159 [Truncatella angustata]
MDQRLAPLQLRLLFLVIEYAQGSETSRIDPGLAPGPGQKVEAIASFLGLEQPAIVPSFEEHELLPQLKNSTAFGFSPTQGLELCRALGIVGAIATLATPAHDNVSGETLLFYKSASPRSNVVALVVPGLNVITPEEPGEAVEGTVALLHQLDVDVFVLCKYTYASKSEEYSERAHIKDVKDTCEWLRRSNPNKQLLLWGLDYGAWPALMAEVTVDLAVSSCGVSSMQADNTDKGTQLNVHGKQASENNESPVSVENRGSISTRFSYMYHVVEGNKVPVDTTLQCAEACVEQGVAIRVVIVPHGPGPRLAAADHVYLNKSIDDVQQIRPIEWEHLDFQEIRRRVKAGEHIEFQNYRDRYVPPQVTLLIFWVTALTRV